MRLTILVSVLVAGVLGATGCDTYYIAPPSTSITLGSAAPSLVISTVNSFGQTVANTMQFTGTVAHNTNTSIQYSIGYDGRYVPGGNNVYGTINAAGVYLAPAVLPTPNTITVQAVALADPTQTATATITLLNPPANVTSVSPAVVTAGQSYTLDLLGTSFAAGATVNISGAQTGTPQIVGSGEIQIPAQVTASGLLTVSVVNPDAAGVANTITVRSQPTAPPASSAIATLIARTGQSGATPVLATKAYVPVNGALAVVNLESGREIQSIPMPNGYAADFAAADPAHDQVIVASRTSNLLQIVNANSDQLAQSLPVAAVQTATTVDGASCEICALMVDSSRGVAILDTGNGYFTVNLATGVASPALIAPAAADFAYDPRTERIYAPYAGANGSGVNVIDFIGQTVTPARLSGGGVLYGTGPDTAALDPGTALLVVGDKNTGTYLALNFNAAVSAPGNVQVAASPFAFGAGCAGIWNGVNLDPANHLGWFANQGACIAVASLPAGPATGAPGAPSQMRWARVPAGPDGLSWINTPVGQPSSLAVYTGPNGHTYGLALRQDGKELLQTDLTLLEAAPPLTGATDSAQVDPTQITVNGQTVSALAYITLR